MTKWESLSSAYTPVFEGDDDGTGSGAGGGSSGGGATGKTFTEDEVNARLGEVEKKYKDQLQKTLDEMKALRTRSQMTDKERKEADERITALEKSLLSKEELARREQEKQARKYEEDLKNASAERDTWKIRYTESTIARSITDAAVKHNAYNPSQVVRLLTNDSRLEAIKGEDGQDNGTFDVKIKLPHVDAKGKAVILDLSADEAVKIMSESDEYANLFKASGTGGVGGGQSKGGKVTPSDIDTLAEDTEAYRAARKAGKI